ncbi:antibiotic biosynthesis monooxygenase [Kineosporia sp. A_224]|uniref:antibiotic biosynthesis monooxygenase family protein n=1 Tax=Kineosporia sp. A_224 TaxID=1962180 RepID=UPI000B4A9247|nr:antibiotic biosynthesis monooxygenase [Kineosporia sp. A_224]
MTDETFARLPEPPYWAVVFSSRRRPAGPALPVGSGAGGAGGAAPDDGYAAAAQRMVDLAATYDGFLGIESARDGDGFGITVSYWSSPEAVRAWKHHAEHAATREQGRAAWYDHYELRVARVERAYGWDVSG